MTFLHRVKFNSSNVIRFQNIWQKISPDFGPISTRGYHFGATWQLHLWRNLGQSIRFVRVDSFEHWRQISAS